jgi:hypothetical protein
VTVPDARERAELQPWCIVHDKSKAELIAELKRLRGVLRPGSGRRRQVSENPADALVQLDDMADRWQRWFAVASEAKGGPTSRNVLDRLPVDVRERVRSVERAVGRLREGLSRHL